ncbi:hypothetical protein [Nonomuraea basaltis]|uniref:hypothetical protein n=1 Tax=Nonomuraea basaltis TaxID=2495887 RepID=UPI0014871F18|nr:hypothetical protein [Nonomuraea basaltis]
MSDQCVVIFCRLILLRAIASRGPYTGVVLADVAQAVMGAAGHADAERRAVVLHRFDQLLTALVLEDPSY